MTSIIVFVDKEIKERSVNDFYTEMHFFRRFKFVFCHKCNIRIAQFHIIFM